jgi:arginine/lysine/ornithine decarboxylase
MSDLYNILCIITAGDAKKDADILIEALRQLAEERKEQAEKVSTQVLLPNIPVLAVTPRDAFYAETELVDFDDSEGKIIAEFIMVYPPGIPIFIPGEVITADNLIYIKKNREAGLPVQGPEDFDFKKLRVIKEHKAIR